MKTQKYLLILFSLTFRILYLGYFLVLLSVSWMTIVSTYQAFTGNPDFHHILGISVIIPFLAMLLYKFSFRKNWESTQLKNIDQWIWKDQEKIRIRKLQRAEAKKARKNRA